MNALSNKRVHLEAHVQAGWLECSCNGMSRRWTDVTEFNAALRASALFSRVAVARHYCLLNSKLLLLYSL